MFNLKRPSVIIIIILVFLDLLGVFYIVLTGDSIQVSRVSAITEIFGLLALVFAGYELAQQQRKPIVQVYFAFPDIKNFYRTKWEGGADSYQADTNARLKRKGNSSMAKPLGFSSSYQCKIFVNNSGNLAGAGIRAELRLSYSLGRALSYLLKDLEWEPTIRFSDPEKWKKLPGESYQTETVFLFNDTRGKILYPSSESFDNGIVKSGLEPFADFSLEFDFSAEERSEPIYLTFTIEGINFNEMRKTIKILPQNVSEQDLLLFGL